MNSRRQFIHKTTTFFAFIATLFNPISSVIRSAYAKTKRLIMELLNMAEAQAGISHVTLRGADTYTEKADRFAIEEIRANKVFLAYQVNGQDLPKKHGFPLRAVAEGHYGSSWTKYVHTVEAEIVN
jgi:sulfoxide reductase catalytic subunit YedY